MIKYRVRNRNGKFIIQYKNDGLFSVWRTLRYVRKFPLDEDVEYEFKNLFSAMEFISYQKEFDRIFKKMK